MGSWPGREHLVAMLVPTLSSPRPSIKGGSSFSKKSSSQVTLKEGNHAEFIGTMTSLRPHPHPPTTTRTHTVPALEGFWEKEIMHVVRGQQTSQKRPDGKYFRLSGSYNSCCDRLTWPLWSQRHRRSCTNGWTWPRANKTLLRDIAI